MAGFAPTASTPGASAESESEGAPPPVALNRIFSDQRKPNGDAIFADQAVAGGASVPGPGSGSPAPNIGITVGFSTASIGLTVKL